MYSGRGQGEGSQPPLPSWHRSIPGVTQTIQRFIDFRRPKSACFKKPCPLLHWHSHLHEKAPQITLELNGALSGHDVTMKLPRAASARHPSTLTINLSYFKLFFVPIPAPPAYDASVVACRREMDISWQVLRQIVRHWADRRRRLAEARPLDGGAISTTVALELADHQKAVAKSPKTASTAATSTKPINSNSSTAWEFPSQKSSKPRSASLEEPFSYILMEFIDGINLSEAKKTCTPNSSNPSGNLAKILLTLHARPGRIPTAASDRIHPPRRFKSWPEFYRRRLRADFQSHSDNAPSRPSAASRSPEFTNVSIHLLEHNDVPRLLHWTSGAATSWSRRMISGNWQVVALLDPDCKFAHVEAELAYMALFHTTTPAFMRAYQQTNRLSDDYHQYAKPNLPALQPNEPPLPLPAQNT